MRTPSTAREGWGEGGRGGGGRSFNSLTVLFDLMVNFPGAFSYGDRKAAPGRLRSFRRAKRRVVAGVSRSVSPFPGMGFRGARDSFLL